MVISNENHLLRNQHLKCSVQREELLKNSSYKQRQCNCSFSGLDSAHKPKVLSMSDIDDEETYLNLPWCTTDLEEDLLPRNQHNVKKEFSYALPEVNEDFSENEPIDALNNFYPIPRNLTFNKENKAIIVNSAFIKNRTNDGTSSRKEEPSPNVLTNQQFNLEKSPPLDESIDVNSTTSEPRKRGKPVEMQANIEKDTFNVMNKEQKMFNDTRFPHHLHSSYITKEYRTTSFFDDFLNSNPSFGSYTNSSADHLKYGCPSDCLRTKIADILKSPIENELNSHIQTRTCQLHPHVCYMEPKCSMSCQGIPNKTLRCGVHRPELKRVPIYNPQYNYTNSCCTSNWDFRNDAGLFDFGERCCRRNPVRSNRNQDATIYQKLPEASYLNDSDAQCRYQRGPHHKRTSFEEINNSEIENDHQEYRYQRGPYYKKRSAENINNSEIENDHQEYRYQRGPHYKKRSAENINNSEIENDQERSTKKKKHFSCCKSGKVDEHEITSHPESTPDQTNSQLNESKNKKYTRSIRQEPYPPIQNINYDHFDCDLDCPMVMQPEKEHHLIYMPPQRITKSIGCDCDRPVAFPRSEDNTKDLGRNITIQIIPNCCQRSCSEHHNTCTVNTPNIRPKNYCQEIPDARQQIDYSTNLGYQEISYPTYESDTSKPVAPRKKQHQYPKYYSKNNCNKWWGCNWRRKKPQTPAYQRNPNCVYTSDCCTTTCQDTEEVIAGDCRMIELSNCQRVLPIKNNYINADKNLLKSLHRLNRGLLKDLFATPCPSTSSACSKTCLQKMRGAPFPMCAGTNPFCQVAKPFTTNQCSQYEPNCCHSEKVRTTRSTQDILLECLRYLKRGIPIDHHCEYSEESCCCCCQNYKCCCRQSFNCCCCNNGCYYHQPRTCEFKEEIQPKSEEKESKTCCTRCRSVEAKQSTKNCGTVVSNHCFTRVETVCTNTETRPKIPEIKKPRKCFRRRCCCCCNNARNCCCENFSCSEPSSCRNIQRSRCNREHFIYHCQCESQPIFQFENLVPNETEEPSYKELLVTDVNKTVSKKTADTDTKETENIDTKEIRSDLSVNPSNSLQKTSNNIYSPVKYRPQRQDVLIKSITLDLCELGEKKISKFGVPSRSYPWMTNSFFVDLPNEMNQFNKNGKFEHFLSERIDDPTPCLKPEVIHISDSKEQECKVGPLDSPSEINESNTREDISDTCRANIENDETYSHSSITNIDNEVIDISISNNSDKKGANIHDGLEIHKILENKKRVSNDDDVHKEMTLKSKNKYQQKNSKNKSKVSLQISTGTSANLSKKPSNISKQSIINYSPKPFTTRTGLMSVIPSFRENYRSPPQVKSRTTVNKNTKITKKFNKTVDVNEQGRSNNARLKKYIISESTVELTGNNYIETEGIPNSTDLNTQDMKYDESEKKGVELKGLEAYEPNEDNNESIDIKTCVEEINASHKRCLSKNDRLKNISNKRVADMIAVMNSKGLDSPAMNKQKETNILPSHPEEKTEQTTFSNEITT